MATTEAAPLYRRGVYAPVPDEIEAIDLPVTGAIPPELNGRYLRNGPNPAPGTDSDHWFTGQGMLHGVRISDGRAQWYRNRWIQTDNAGEEPVYGPDGRDLRRNSANTHIVEHGGALLTLCEGGLPYQVTPDLDTVGPHDFGGRLRTAMTAHPKTDPVTGELFFYGYSAVWPYLTFHIADSRGNLTTSSPIDVPGPTMMHDFAITQHYVVWLDLPVVFDQRPASSMPFSWSEDYGARIGIMPRDGGPVTWIEIGPCFVFHVGNAREDHQGRVILDAVRYAPETFRSIWEGPMRRNSTAQGHGSLVADEAKTSVLYRWRLDPVSATVSEQQLDDREIEFPSINDDNTGHHSRYLYAVSGARNGGVIKYDTSTETVAEHHFTKQHHVGEAVFVPAAQSADEDAGWLISIATPIDGGGSSLVIMDATDVAAGPVATVGLPRRVPAGFHGSWICDAEEKK